MPEPVTFINRFLRVQSMNRDSFGRLETDFINYMNLYLDAYGINRHVFSALNSLSTDKDLEALISDMVEHSFCFNSDRWEISELFRAIVTFHSLKNAYITRLRSQRNQTSSYTIISSTPRTASSIFQAFS